MFVFLHRFELVTFLFSAHVANILKKNYSYRNHITQVVLGAMKEQSQGRCPVPNPQAFTFLGRATVYLALPGALHCTAGSD